jgi:hypothetical protein
MVINKDWLPYEGLPALFDLLGRKGIMIVVCPGRDHPGPDIEIARARFVLKRDPVS